MFLFYKYLHYLCRKYSKKMADYKRFYVQQQSYDGSSYTNVGDAVELGTYNVVCQEFPFKYLPETKELPKRDWPDENGDDVYFPTDGLKMKAFDMDVKFLYAGPISTYTQDGNTIYGMRDNLTRLISFLRGRNSDGSPCLLIYDEYTDIALCGVYVSEISNDLYEYNDVNINAHAVFKVKFRVTNPVPTTFTLPT